MSDYFRDDELEELERQDDGSDPFAGVSEKEKLKVLLTIEKMIFSDTLLYCLRGAAVLLDILILPWVFKSIGATGGKDVGPMGALYLLAIVFCFLISYTAFELKNCKQRVEEKLQAEKEQKAEAELARRLSGIDVLTITDKVTFKRVAARSLLYVGSVFALIIVLIGGGIAITDGFSKLVRDLFSIQEWIDFFVYPVFLAAFMSLGSLCLVVFAWQGSCLTFNKSGISGEVYNAFQKAENVIDYCAEKNRKTGHIIERYYDINTESQPNCIKWSNFKCFSVHRNCIVLWQKEQMQGGFLTKLYVRFGWNLCLNQYPLRILGTPAELAELKHMLSQVMPYCRNFLPGEKAIL